MDIVFKNNKLKKVFCSEQGLLTAYGSENAKKIQNRMVILRAARNLAEVPIVPPLHRHQLKGQYKGFFAVDVKQPFRLIFRPANEPVPKLEDGGIDLKAVTQIEIITVEDYH